MLLLVINCSMTDYLSYFYPWFFLCVLISGGGYAKPDELILTPPHLVDKIGHGGRTKNLFLLIQGSLHVLQLDLHENFLKDVT